MARDEQSIPSMHATDNMTPEQRARVEEIKRERATIHNVFDRIAFDNQAVCTKDAGLYLVAALESAPRSK
jgi:hypothetical protein